MFKKFVAQLFSRSRILVMKKICVYLFGKKLITSGLVINFYRAKSTQIFSITRPRDLEKSWATNFWTLLVCCSCFHNVTLLCNVLALSSSILFHWIQIHIYMHARLPIPLKKSLSQFLYSLQPNRFCFLNDVNCFQTDICTLLRLHGFLLLLKGCPVAFNNFWSSNFIWILIPLLIVIV